MNFYNLIILFFINFLSSFWQTQIIHGQLYNAFDQEYCDIRCGNRVHTLCETITLPECNLYKKFNLFELNGMQHGKFLNLLINGHNGIRDRIAKKMNVSNMVKVSWDAVLADMCLEYFKQCTPDDDDECTTFTADELTIQEQVEYRDIEIDNHRFIVQNRFTIASDSFPQNFLENALRAWYYEKNTMHAPKYNDSLYADHTIGLLMEETNFTHMAYPLISNVGCCIAQIDRHYDLICNYYPYYRKSDGVMVFVSGPTANTCPSFFPLPDLLYTNLCCNGDAMGWDDNLSNRLMSASDFTLVAISAVIRIIF